MIKARHKKFHDWFFTHYSRMMMHRHFDTVNIKNTIELEEKSVLLIGNHFSWWDGFIAKYLNDKYFQRIFHVMMLENELKDRMFLNKAGAFSIMKNSKSIIETITYTNDLLASKDNLVTIYPQGKFYSIHQQPIKFEHGFLKHLLKKGSSFQIVFYVALIDYFEKPKPTLTIGLKKLDTQFETPEQIEKEFNNYYMLLTSEQQQK